MKTITTSIRRPRLRSAPPAGPLTAVRAPALTPVHQRPGFDFSVTGLVYSSIMMFMGLAAVNTQTSLLFAVFGLMIGILLVSGIISKRMLRRITLRRLLPDQASVGTPMLIHYTIENQKRRWPTFSVTIAEIDGVQGFRRQPHAYLLHVAPRMTAAINCEVIPKRRGLHRLGKHQLSTSFPFGFIKRAVIREQEDAVLVFPPLATVDPRLLRLFQSSESSGSHLRPRVGGTDEFYGLKEYRQGENPRLIYWKRSAHTGTLVSREMTHVAPPRLVVLVDTYDAGPASPDRAGDRGSTRPPEPAGDAARPERRVELEVSIAQAASLIDSACEAGLAIGLVAWSGQWVTIAPNRGKRHRRELLSMLAQLPANPVHPVEELMQQGSILQDAATTAVLFTRGDTASVSCPSGRGSPFIIGALSERARAWFTFEPELDFSQIAPVPQEPSSAQRRRRSDTKHATPVSAAS